MTIGERLIIWRLRRQIQQRAMACVAAALKSGRLRKQSCAVCKHPKTHAHHEDYSKPLEVIWLCSLHHAAVHAKVARVSSPLAGGKRRWEYTLQTIADAAGLSVHTVRDHKRAGELDPADFLRTCKYVVSNDILVNIRKRNDVNA
jgi:hypothetical protein